ncbi:hypothetical protein ACFP9V_25650 [Deinococcus radiopugnans]|uniref:hypothetical protein n=1 Tax=Deinococcus radiopugnans TaxID=57497 RepID=UPI00361589DA
MQKLLLLSGLGAALLVACGGGGTTPPKEDNGGPGNPPPGDARAYAVTAKALYSIVLSGMGQDEKKFDLKVGQSLTDVALDGTELYGVTISTLVRISLSNGAVSTVGALGTGDINALTADGAGNLYGASTGASSTKSTRPRGRPLLSVRWAPFPAAIWPSTLLGNCTARSGPPSFLPIRWPALIRPQAKPQ